MSKATLRAASHSAGDFQLAKGANECRFWVRIGRKVASSAFLLFHRKPNSWRSVPVTGRKFEAAASDAWGRLLRERRSGQQLLILTLLAEP